MQLFTVYFTPKQSLRFLTFILQMTSSSSTADCVILTLASLSWVVALLSYKFPQVWLAMNRSKSPTRTSSTSARSICWGKQPISPSGLEAIANHKYRSAGYTPLDLLMDKFWTWIAQFVPASVAPNAITFTGLLMVTPAFFTVVYYGSAIETERPRWIGLLAAATMFVYQVCHLKRLWISCCCFCLSCALALSVPPIVLIHDTWLHPSFNQFTPLYKPRFFL